MSRYIYEGDMYGTTQAEDIKLTEKQNINNVEVDNADDAIKNINAVMKKSGILDDVSYDETTNTYNFGKPATNGT